MRLQVTRKEKGMATFGLSFSVSTGALLQVTRKEKGMATPSNRVPEYPLDFQLQVTRKEKGMATLFVY